MLIMGCDFHPRFQQIAMMDAETGELVERRLEHENGEARAFYASLPKPVLVGMEAPGYAQWFGRMLAEFGHELWIGHASEIRAGVVRKQKTDARDASTCCACCWRSGFHGFGYRLRPSGTHGNCCDTATNWFVFGFR